MAGDDPDGVDMDGLACGNDCVTLGIGDGGDDEGEITDSVDGDDDDSDVGSAVSCIAGEPSAVDGVGG